MPVSCVYQTQHRPSPVAYALCYLCFISVGSGPLLPRGSQLEGVPLEETQNWEVAGARGSERPRIGHHSQEKEGLWGPEM